ARPQIKCFACGEIGHANYECQSGPKSAALTVAGRPRNICNKSGKGFVIKEKDGRQNSSTASSSKVNFRGNSGAFSKTYAKTKAIVCFYCKKPGHVITNCPKLEAKKEEPVLQFGPLEKSQTLRNKVQTLPSVDSELCIADSNTPGNDENDLGIENLLDSQDDSFDSDIGGRDGGFVSGIVKVGVSVELPVPGVQMLLSNDLAGDKVVPEPIMCENQFDEEATVEVNHVVKNEDVLADSKKRKPDGDKQYNEIVYPACVVTRAMSKRREEFDGDLGIGDIFSKEDLMTT
ncbi:putative pol Retrovirus-related Pol polyprotein from transposon-like 21, partial [Homarus americanus]